jgi:hypothetical protein
MRDACTTGREVYCQSSPSALLTQSYARLDFIGALTGDGQKDGSNNGHNAPVGARNASDGIEFDLSGDLRASRTCKDFPEENRSKITCL